MELNEVLDNAPKINSLFIDGATFVILLSIVYILAVLAKVSYNNFKYHDDPEDKPEINKGLVKLATTTIVVLFLCLSFAAHQTHKWNNDYISVYLKSMDKIRSEETLSIPLYKKGYHVSHILDGEVVEDKVMTVKITDEKEAYLTQVVNEVEFDLAGFGGVPYVGDRSNTTLYIPKGFAKDHRRGNY